MSVAARLLGLVALTALPAVACKDVVGLNEYTFVDDSQTAGQGGGGSGGGGGGAGGGTPGKCGDTPPAPPESLVTACVFGTGCAPYNAITLSNCITNSSFTSIGGLGCLATAKKCVDVEDCIGQRILPVTTCAAPGHWTCDAAGEATYCDAALSYRYECSRIGAKCDSGAAAANGPDSPPCVLGNETCAADGPRCDNETLVNCQGGKAFGDACSLQNGAHCKQRVDGKGFACVHGSGDCPADLMAGKGRCKDASTGETCNPFATYFTFDCSKAGLACVTETASFHCLAPGCSPAEVAQIACAESCSGNTANVCVGGLPYPIDCASEAHGSGTCVASMEGNVPVAHCRPAP